jgi:hypothetical protein
LGEFVKPLEHISADRSQRAGTPARLRPAGLLLGAIVAAAPAGAFADTILNFDLTPSSDVAGSASGSPSAFCVVGNACPSDPAYALGANTLLIGALSIDTTNQTMTFDLSMESAQFGTMAVGTSSTFVASSTDPVSVSVSSSTSHGVTTYTVLPGTTTSAITATLGALLPSGFTQTGNQPLISGIDCSVTASGGTCGFVLGTPPSGTNVLQIASGGTSYDGVLSLNANLTQVPLPAALPLLLSGFGFLGAAARRHSRASPAAA